MYIFDMDGTLTDSNGLWLEVDEEFLSRRGLRTTREYQDMVGRSIFPVAAKFTIDYFGLSDTPEAIMEEWESLAAYHYANTVALKEGALELLKRCKADGIPMALFTACRPTLSRSVLERHNLLHYFDHIVFAEEIGLEKHDPRCFLRLCQLIGADPGECTLFDDNPSNCATALSAGMRAVGVYDDFYAHRQEELKASSTRYVTSLAQLL